MRPRTWPELRGLGMADCRDCGGPIRFVTLESGSVMPVGPLPHEDGNVYARRIGPRLHGFVITGRRSPDPMFLRFMPHAAVCPERPTPPNPHAGQTALF